MKPRVRAPTTAKAGEIVEIRTLVTHVMETGQRRALDGRPIARNIIHTFTATFEGVPVFKADLNTGVSANPYLAFHLRVTKPGKLVMTWSDDQGAVAVETTAIALA